MDAYPQGSLDHNVPLIVVSGLNSNSFELPLSDELKDQSILIRSELPPLDTKEAQVLDEHFKELDAQGRSWAGVARDEKFRCRIKSTGRSLLLPPRRARLVDDDDTTPSSPPVLHSPFSPLSPASSLYPDGLIDAQWINKHQELVPSTLLCFYTISSDPTTTTLQDNKLKNDIGVLKGALASSGYKTKLCVALLNDADSTPATLASGLQERLTNISRGAGLDPKTLFYIPPQESPAELKDVADNILSSLYASAVEYYRDLGRHARKKRSRGIAPQPTVPPTSGTSRSLSLPDWNFRYDFKSAVLGEFRQEYDAAMKSYEQAYEVLLGQDVFDVIPSWSPRWNEARLLADLIAIRLLRLHFWMGQTSLAVRRWQAHRDRIADFVDRVKGIDNYGWFAWESRWAVVMADLMDKVELQGLEPSSTTLFLPPERAVLGDRLQPWELLHHKGYWYRMAARHLATRRDLAYQIPDEDRVEPEKGAKKTYNYDTYLCPEPHDERPLDGEGINHAKLIVDYLILARTQYQSRHQIRTAAELSLECAKEMSNMESWKEMLSILRPLWEDMTYRSEGWPDISEDLCWLLRRAAVEDGRGDLVVAVDWELLNRRFTRRPHWPYDISKSLDGMSISDKPSVSLTDKEAMSFVDATFVFRGKESRAGDLCPAQLTLYSHAFADSAPVTLSELYIEFDGGLKPIKLENIAADEAAQDSISISTLDLQETFDDDASDDLPTSLHGECDLTLTPGSRRVIEMNIPLREAGEVSASSLKLVYYCESFDLSYQMRLGSTDQANGWYYAGSSKPRHTRSDGHLLQVHPRPPKLDIKLVEPLNQYYTNERIELRVQLNNAEDEGATVKLDAHLFGKPVPAFKLSVENEERAASAADEESKITGFPVGKLDSSSSYDLKLLIDPSEGPGTFDLHLRASYHLESDTATPIMQMLPVTLTVVNPFEANYDLVPRLHPEPWPNLFDYDNVLSSDEQEKLAATASGLAQNWCLICHYGSFATEELVVRGMEMKVVSKPSSVRCDVSKIPHVSDEGLPVVPGSMHEARFDLTAQKISLDDRQPVSLELAVVIQWQRKGEAEQPVNTATLVAGSYLVLSTEPRVLASSLASPATAAQPEGLMHLDITVENPSSHFLTFGLTMEPSDEFAFSGAKSTTVHLLPMARRTVTYRLLPLVTGTFVRPGLVVRDKYFQKVLRIIPTEGMKIDKDGLLVWIPPAEVSETTDDGESSPPKE